MVKITTRKRTLRPILHGVEFNAEGESIAHWTFDDDWRPLIRAKLAKPPRRPTVIKTFGRIQK